ncbi:MAG: aminopeptidase N [Pseudomonadales bacterium]|nr:aminopeptidase N [Pseudomonadales bacterium]
MRDAQARTVYLKDYRVPDFLIDETFLNVELFEDRALVSSRLLIRRNPASERPDAPLVLDGQDLELQAVAVAGKPLQAEDYQLDAGSLCIPGVPDQFSLECRTLIRPQLNTSLEGLYKSGNMFCTQCEAEGFRKISYYLDRPDVLSSFTTTIHADEDKYPVLLSNGNNTAKGKSADGRHWQTWHDPFKKPAYLFALVAGDLQALSDSFTTCSGREISLRIFVEAKDLDKCDFALSSLKKAMAWDEEVYGREYDLDIFMIVAVDHFNMGAMENKGLNIFNSSCVLAKPETTTDAAFQRIESIVAHEYFHNWSGNRVTCRDWFQLSLKEGFTVFRDSEFSADMGSRTVNRVEDVSFLRTVQFAEDAGPMAHSVRPESYMEISNFYTVTIYEKGAEVVRMMAQLLGPDVFRKGTDLYFERFDGMAVTTEDFVSTMEEVSGLDLSQFRRWYTQAGTPELIVTEQYQAEDRSYHLTVKQRCAPTPGQASKENFFIPLKLALLDSEGRELPLQLRGQMPLPSSETVLALTQAEETFVFENISERPVPSLLRSFSAPVKLSMTRSRDDLMFLMSHDSDGFVRWESAQQLGLQVLDELLEQRRQGRQLAVDARLSEAFARVLQSALADTDVDLAMLAQLLILPTEAYMGELAAEVDVDGIHEVREFLRLDLARKLKAPLSAVHQRFAKARPYQFNAQEVARRTLANAVLAYLTLLDDPVWIKSCHAQFLHADNMTDVSAALRMLVNIESGLATERVPECLDMFYAKWQHEPLVVEQWLALQAGANLPDNLERVKKLMTHEAFDIRNPNKVRSVIGAFCNQNLVGFHQESGAGYAFLAEQVIALDALNPQIAARQLTPLTRWKKHNARRRQLMQAQLRRIMAGKLSPDVYEVVSKALKAN